MTTRPSLSNLAGQPVIIGAGAAGLMTALSLAPMPCVLVCAGSIGGDSSSLLAQGGLAAAMGADDNVALHLADTLAAGDGHCDREAAARIIGAAPQAMARLLELGAQFDRNADGSLALGLEAAHSRRRILHAHGDASGAEVVRTLAAAVRRAPHITVLEDILASEILTHNEAVTGVVLHDGSGRGAPIILPTAIVVLATGGLGGLFACTTNPLSSTGAGIALAARAGAELADMEFVQFHPTALDVGASNGQIHVPAPLISEAVRGEGALLVNDLGERFMADTPGAELAPRDIVARAIWRQQQAGRRVFLDARVQPGAGFARRFPAITQLCLAAGLDPMRDLLPVTPAAHYHMGGVAVDAHGRASITGLWACGEVACTGLHGANRLASNSLIEALTCGGFVARDIEEQMTGPAANACSRSRALASFKALTPRSGAITSGPTPEMGGIRALMSRHVGLERDAGGLCLAINQLTPFAAEPRHPASNAALVGLLIAHSALARRESRGAHCRSDFLARSSASPQSRIRLADIWPASFDTKIAS